MVWGCFLIAYNGERKKKKITVYVYALKRREVKLTFS